MLWGPVPCGIISVPPALARRGFFCLIQFQRIQQLVHQWAELPGDLLKYPLGGGLVIDVGGQIPGVPQVDPALLLLEQSGGIGLAHHRLGAVDSVGKTLVDQILPGGLPGQLRAHLKALDRPIPDTVQVIGLA